MANMTTLQILQGVHDWVLDKIDEETANFITKTVNDLVNYYTKSETYTKAEVQQIVDAIKQFTYEVVQVLPTASASTMNKIYLVPAPKSEDKNVKEEYITIQDGSTYSWEMLGTTSIDLSNYYTKGQTDSAISSALSSALASYTTTADLTTLLSQKQDVIQDLADIRSGASAGSTAVQPSTLNDAVKNVVAESGVYDVSANNDNTKFESLSALLSSANLNTLIPTDIRKGGMSIKFVLSSDNKYVQFRYMSSSTDAADFTNVAYWQGVDDVPMAGSDNLVKSGGVYTELEKKANIDGYYETMGVGTADNLTGQTERTDDAMYRKTGGSEEVASGTATISNIKGNTIAWNQMLHNGNFVDSTSWYGQGGTYTVSNNVAIITPTIVNGGISNKAKFLRGHKHYICFNYCPTKALVLLYKGGNSIGTYDLSKGVRISHIFDGAGEGYIWFRFSQIAFTYYLSNVNIIDLTLIYGAGNEPTTPEQFEADYFKWFGKPLDYEEYDGGSLRSVQLDALKTTGFNQYNNGQARVIGGLQYQITGTYTKLYPTVTLTDYTYGDTVTAGTYYTNDNNHFVGVKNVSTYDNTKTYALGEYCAYNGAIYKSNVAVETAEEFDATHWDIIADVAAMVTEGILTLWDIIPDANGLFTPSTTGTLTIVGGGNDTCIHISGDRNGEYEPYEEHSVSLPVTTITGKLNGEGESVVIFPDGMKSAGTVYDEIYTIGDKTYAVKRVGGVDLGTLSWRKISNSGKNTYHYASSVVNNIKHFNNSSTQSIICSRLRYYRLGYIEAGICPDKSISANTSLHMDNKIIYAYDSSYTDASTFKTAMNGVMLYYELATTQVFELDTFDLPTRYQVDSNGTEEQIQNSGVQGLAAILTCIYGVDAVKILDKLPQNYISEKSMDNFLAQLNNVTGGTWTKTWNDNTGEWDFSFTPNAQTNDTNIEETI